MKPRVYFFFFTVNTSYIDLNYRQFFVVCPLCREDSIVVRTSRIKSPRWWELKKQFTWSFKTAINHDCAKPRETVVLPRTIQRLTQMRDERKKEKEREKERNNNDFTENREVEPFRSQIQPDNV